MYQLFDHLFLGQRVGSQIWMLATPVLGIQLILMIIGCHDMQEFRPAKRRVEVSAGWEVPLKAEETTDMTTSHLTNPAKDAGQVIGYSHSAMPPKNGGQAAGYSHATELLAEELLMKPLAIPLGCQKTPAKWLVMAGHPKDGCQMLGYAA
jgi:hypothetical protein